MKWHRSDWTGLPRPTALPDNPFLSQDKSLRFPVPWINQAPVDGVADFTAFQDDSRRAEAERLCCICGDPLKHVVAIGAGNGRRETSAGWGHPRCVQLAVALCPHFNDSHAQTWDTVAWLHHGEGVGVYDIELVGFDPVVDTATTLTRDGLKVLAQTDPWGDRADPCQLVIHA